MIFDKNTKKMSDQDLLDSQKESKMPFIDFMLSNKWYVFLLKLLIAYIASFVFEHFNLFVGYSIFIAYFGLEVIVYNYFNQEMIAP